MNKELEKDATKPSEKQTELPDVFRKQTIYIYIYIYIYMILGDIWICHSFCEEDYSVLRYDAILIGTQGCIISHNTVIFIQGMNLLIHKQARNILTGQ
jgi:hypothetical protein